MPRGRGRGRGRFSRSVHAVMRNTLRSMESGRIMRVSPDPPQITPSPWNTVTVMIGDTGDKTITSKYLVKVLLVQLGLSDELTVYFRVQHVRVWQLGRSRPLKVGFYSIIGESNRVEVEDWPSAIAFPRVGYEWAKSRQDTVLSIAGSDDILFDVDVGKDQAWLAYVHIHWRTQGSKISYSFDEGILKSLSLA